LLIQLVAVFRERIDGADPPKKPKASSKREFLTDRDEGQAKRPRNLTRFVQPAWQSWQMHLTSLLSYGVFSYSVSTASTGRVQHEVEVVEVPTKRTGGLLIPKKLGAAPAPPPADLHDTQAHLEAAGPVASAATVPQVMPTVIPQSAQVASDPRRVRFLHVLKQQPC
jgi:hypothetical protein